MGQSHFIFAVLHFRRRSPQAAVDGRGSAVFLCGGPVIVTGDHGEQSITKTNRQGASFFACYARGMTGMCRGAFKKGRVRRDRVFGPMMEPFDSDAEL
jgi:hypothetical protein